VKQRMVARPLPIAALSFPSMHAIVRPLHRGGNLDRSRQQPDLGVAQRA
jgi:hypothetical protein